MAKTARSRPRTAESPQFRRPSPKKPQKRRNRRPATYKSLTTAEKDRLFAAIDKQPDVATRLRDRAIFRIAFHHGLRVSEIALIEMVHYRKGKSSLESDVLYLTRLKGSVSGDAILVPAAAAALRAWLRERGYDDGPIFLSRNHRPISSRRLDEIMKRYCAVAGIPPEKAHFHTLKHTCGTLLMSERGEHVEHVQAQLGHADIRSTMIYARLTAGANRARAQRLRDWR